ncbi:MAG: hypothetical protein IPK13_23690 [Deltaproteobacteria bacterium]|nr:hypothetical protein [Deltaproteobacteria bacterium]
MNRVSIRQPVVLYAVVFMLALAAMVLALSTIALVSASRRAYRRAAHNELMAISLRGPSHEVRHWLHNRPRTLEMEIGLVTPSQPALGVTIEDARKGVGQIERGGDIVVVPVDAPGEEAYLVGLVDPSIPTSIALVEMSRMAPFVLVGALVCAGLLAFMVTRLLLPPLSILGEIAKDASALRAGLDANDTPNEILEIAQQFRQTVRQLRTEQAQIATQKAELERMQAGLIRASKLASVGRLAAGIAHEIGNPLAAVLGYLSLLKEGLDPPARDEVLERSAKELTRISETIRKLLMYARKGEEPHEPSVPISTERIIGEALALVRGHPLLRGVSITRTEGQRPTHGTQREADALGHADRLNQVLVNLLLNAAHAMETSAVRSLSIERTTTRDDVRIAIRDSGSGIEPELLEQIFDPFFTTKDPGEGTGLGLAISRAIMESMDGDLTVTSDVGQGACFTVRLPRVPEASMHESNEDLAPPDPAS